MLLEIFEQLFFLIPACSSKPLQLKMKTRQARSVKIIYFILSFIDAEYVILCNKIVTLNQAITWPRKGGQES